MLINLLVLAFDDGLVGSWSGSIFKGRACDLYGLAYDAGTRVRLNHGIDSPAYLSPDSGHA